MCDRDIYICRLTVHLIESRYSNTIGAVERHWTLYTRTIVIDFIIIELNHTRA